MYIIIFHHYFFHIIIVNIFLKTYVMVLWEVIWEVNAKYIALWSVQ
jgi:hypothetical protein